MQRESVSKMALTVEQMKDLSLLSPSAVLIAIATEKKKESQRIKADV